MSFFHNVYEINYKLPGHDKVLIKRLVGDEESDVTNLFKMFEKEAEIVSVNKVN